MTSAEFELRTVVIRNDRGKIFPPSKMFEALMRYCWMKYNSSCYGMFLGVSWLDCVTVLVNDINHYLDVTNTVLVYSLLLASTARS